MILWSKIQENFFSKKKLFKKIKKIQTLYLIRLVSDSLGEPMGWAFMGWTNRVWKPNSTELTLMSWAGTFVQNPTLRPPYQWGGFGCSMWVLPNSTTILTRELSALESSKMLSLSHSRSSRLLSSSLLSWFLLSRYDRLFKDSSRVVVGLNKTRRGCPNPTYWWGWTPYFIQWVEVLASPWVGRSWVGQIGFENPTRSDSHPWVEQELLFKTQPYDHSNRSHIISHNTASYHETF
jgi:hypothetical protein